MLNINAVLSELCPAHQLDFEGADCRIDGRSLYVSGISKAARTGIKLGRWEWNQIGALAEVIDVVIIETVDGGVMELPMVDSQPYYQQLKSRAQTMMIDTLFRDSVFQPCGDTGILTPNELRNAVRNSSSKAVLTSMDSGRVLAVSNSYAEWTGRSPYEWEADTGNLARWNSDSLAQTVRWLEESNGVLNEHTTIGAHCVTGQVYEWHGTIKLVHYGNVLCRLTHYDGRREHNLSMA